MVLDMGGVLIPEVPDYDGAARDPALLRRLSSFGVDDPGGLVTSAGRRVRSAYRALASACTQPDLGVVLVDLQEDVRNLLLRAFAVEATQRPWSFARETVALLARHHRLGLVSNTVLPGDHHARSLHRAGVLQHFDCAVWSANFGVRKPDPSMLHFMLRQLGIQPREAVFVGDKLRTDVACARRAGVRSIWLRRGPPLVEGATPTPDFVIQDLRSLPFLLRSLR